MGGNSLPEAPALQQDHGVRDAPDPGPRRLRPGRARLMYIEDKSHGIDTPGRIGWVHFSKSGRSLYYQGRRFHRLGGQGFKANYFEEATGAHHWISGPRRDRNDRLYGGARGVEVDRDARAAYRAFLKGV